MAKPWDEYGPDDDVPINPMIGAQTRSRIDEDKLIVSIQYMQDIEGADVPNTIHLTMLPDVAEEFAKGLLKSVREHWRDRASRRMH